MNEEINEIRAQLDAYKKAKDRFEKDRAFKLMGNNAVTNVVALLEAVDTLLQKEGEATDKVKELESQRASDLQSAQEWGAELVRLHKQIANTVSDKEARKELQAVKVLRDVAQARADDYDRIGRDALRRAGHKDADQWGAAFAIGWLENRLKEARAEIETVSRRFVEDNTRRVSAEAQRDMLRGEVEMLRGVGCGEPAFIGEETPDGPCGACLKCVRRERDEALIDNKRLRIENKHCVRAIDWADSEIKKLRQKLLSVRELWLAQMPADESARLRRYVECCDECRTRLPPEWWDFEPSEKDTL